MIQNQSQYKTEQMGEAVFKRLQKDDATYIVYDIVDTIFSFENKEYNNRLTNYFENNRGKWDRGSCSASFREMFEINGVDVK